MKKFYVFFSLNLIYFLLPIFNKKPPNNPIAIGENLEISGGKKGVRLMPI